MTFFSYLLKECICKWCYSSTICHHYSNSFTVGILTWLASKHTYIFKGSIKLPLPHQHSTTTSLDLPEIWWLWNLIRMLQNCTWSVLFEYPLSYWKLNMTQSITFEIKRLVHGDVGKNVYLIYVIRLYLEPKCISLTSIFMHLSNRLN